MLSLAEHSTLRDEVAAPLKRLKRSTDVPHDALASLTNDELAAVSASTLDQLLAFAFAVLTRPSAHVGNCIDLRTMFALAATLRAFQTLSDPVCMLNPAAFARTGRLLDLALLLGSVEGAPGLTLAIRAALSAVGMERERTLPRRSKRRRAEVVGPPCAHGLAEVATLVPEPKSQWAAGSAAQMGRVPGFGGRIVPLCLGAEPCKLLDVLGEMRDDKAEREEDLRNVDFVSGINRAEFDQVGIDFDQYRKNYHNTKHYFYYKLYLVRREKTEYTGQESVRHRRLCI